MPLALWGHVGRWRRLISSMALILAHGLTQWKEATLKPNKTGDLLAETRGGRTPHPCQTIDSKAYHKTTDTAETAQTGGCGTNVTVALLELTRGYSAIIDAEDYDWLSYYTWTTAPRSGGRVYAVTTDIAGRRVYLSRFIMRPPPGYVVDHISGDTLDNRRANLRICTQQQNACNQRLNGRNKTGYKGVILCPNGRYKGKIQVNGQGIHLGYFDTAEKAAAAYDAAAREQFGEYARLNLGGIRMTPPSHGLRAGGGR
jgi:hypothetical protein